MNCEQALQTLLDHVDYTSGACHLNEPVGGVLPIEIIMLCRQAIAEEKEILAIDINPESWTKCDTCGLLHDHRVTRCFL